MTRRITLAILATVVITLLVAGLGTLGLARLGARQQTEHDLRSQSGEIATSLRDLTDEGALRVVVGLRRSLRLEGLEVVRFGPAGRPIGSPPPGVSMVDLDLDRLRAGTTVSGNHGALVFAASPVTLRVRGEDILAVVVVTRAADPLLRPALGWFLVASIVTLAIGALIAWQLGRRLARPLRQAEVATRRIAAGDLSARVPEGPGRADDELHSLLGSINVMASGLERSQGLERQFLLSVSHDLRTPLTSIRGYAEAITDRAIPDPAAGAAVILAEARRLERLVRDLLDLAKLEARQFSLQLEPVDLVDVAAGTADGFRPEADEAGVTIEVVVPDQPVPVRGDPDRLAQVGANLVENAMKYAATRVRLVVGEDAGWARLDVADDGPGIAADDLPHVFERLYVARHEPQRTEVGSGLGLAIVRELVSAMGGRVEAVATPGSGATLSVLLPLDPAVF
ncbi:MAG: HAMP domain-containing sensor histidine kinase [Acidimicrobiales bacterium]